MGDEQIVNYLAEGEFVRIINAGPCVHSMHKPDCASCLRHAIWYWGRIDGLKEAADLLAANSAMSDAMRKACDEADKERPWLQHEND